MGLIRRAQAALALAVGTPDPVSLRICGELSAGPRRFPVGSPALRLLWLVSAHADELWLPTADECDDAYRAWARGHAWVVTHVGDQP